MVDGLIGYAFTLGVLAAINPCGFALLPVYVAQFARAEDTGASVPRRVLRAVGSSMIVAIGFVSVFGAVGAVLMAGTAFFMRWVPWAMVLVAGALVAAGIAGLTGRWSPRLPRMTPSRSGRSPRAMIGFGAAYAVASLSCALPVFLAGVAGAFLQHRPLAGLVDFLAYAVGMGVLLTGVSVVVTLGGAALLRRLRHASRWIAPITSVVVVAMGTYLLYYWITYLVAPGTSFPLTTLLERAQAEVANWLGDAGVWVGAGIAATVAMLLMGFWLRRHVGAANAALTVLVLPGLLVPAALLASSISSDRSVTASSMRSPLGVGPAVQRLTSLTPIKPPHPAPPVSLTDQHGNDVSLRDFRGKAIVLAFMDSHSADTSLLYARDVRAASRQLGPLSKRVAFVGINVNERYNGVSDVADFTRRTGLASLANWHFLTGSAAALQRVRDAYGVYAEQQGATVGFNGVLYFIDPQGRGRAGGMYGGSSQATERWGRSLVSISRALLGLPVETPDFALPRPGELPGVNVGGARPAPNTTLPRLFHPQQRVSLTDLRGKPVVVNFWASWCPPCRREMPMLQAASVDYRGKVDFVGIDIDDSPDAARRAARAAGLSYTLLEDARGLAASAFRVVNLPTTVFIAPDGTVTLRHTGALNRADLDRALGGLLSRTR